MKLALFFAGTMISGCLFSIACSAPVARQNVQVADSNLNPDPIVTPTPVQTPSPKPGKCVFDFTELKTRFERGPLEDEYIADEKRYLERLRKCPLDGVATQILEFKKSHDDNLGFKAKSAYLLARLGFQKERYADELIEVYSVFRVKTSEIYRLSGWEAVYEFERVHINDETLIGLICETVESERSDTKILMSSMRIMHLTDGAWATALFHTYSKRFERNPRQFLSAITELNEGDHALMFDEFCIQIGTVELTKTLKKQRSAMPELVDHTLAHIQNSEACRDS